MDLGLEAQCKTWRRLDAVICFIEIAAVKKNVNQA
jgi:hypothetical protein